MRFPAASDCLDLKSGIPQFIPQKISLAKQFVALGDQGLWNSDVARARCAGQRILGILG
jgi:hypothetical protein